MLAQVPHPCPQVPLPPCPPCERCSSNPGCPGGDAACGVLNVSLWIGRLADLSETVQGAGDRGRPLCESCTAALAWLLRLALRLEVTGQSTTVYDAIRLLAQEMATGTCGMQAGEMIVYTIPAQAQGSDGLHCKLQRAAPSE